MIDFNNLSSGDKEKMSFFATQYTKELLLLYIAYKLGIVKKERLAKFVKKLLGE